MPKPEKCDATMRPHLKPVQLDVYGVWRDLKGKPVDPQSVHGPAVPCKIDKGHGGGCDFGKTPKRKK